MVHFELVPHGVRIVQECRFEKFLIVIDWLSLMALEIVLDGRDLLLVGVVSSLVIVIIIACSDHNPFGVPLLPVFASLGAFPRAFTGSLGWCPLAAAWDHFLVALNEDGHDCFITRSALGGDVKQLLRGLWLVVAEIAGPECRNDIGIVNPREFMTLLGESMNVILESFAHLLLATHLVCGVDAMHIRPPNYQLCGPAKPETCPLGKWGGTG
jgi:hypothetical protein